MIRHIDKDCVVNDDVDYLDPLVCLDSDLDTCGDCSVGVDGYGPG